MSDHVCEEWLIVEIFTRLPPKSLLRFRSLSKSWYSIISSPSFIRMHASRSPQKVLFSHIIRRDGVFYTLHAEDQLPLCPERAYIGIIPTRVQSGFPRYGCAVGSCNGIFCLHANYKGMSLWNPSIRRRLILPNCPLVINAMIGFGFDPISDDYKIVGIHSERYGNDKDQPSFVYSVKTDTWCAIASPTPLSDISPGAIFLNGVLHWMVTSHNIGRSYILTFDLNSHVFGMISLPEQCRITMDILGSIQGSLAVIVHDRSRNIEDPYMVTDVVDCSIWVRRDASWSLVFEEKIKNQILKRRVFKWKGKHGISNVLQLTSNGDLLISYFVEGVEVYNPTKMEARSTLVEFNGGSHIQDMYPYVESLYLLDTGTAYEGNKPPCPFIS